MLVTLDDGTELTGDTLVIGLGIEPRISLAEEAGLTIDDENQGVEVNEQLQTSDNSIWSSGDMASYPDKIVRRQRIEHVDHARISGELVGKNMAGGKEAYSHTPYFYSNVFSIAWKAIGKLDPELETIFDERKNGKIVFYLEEDKVVGVLTWNVEVDLDDIRAVLADSPSDKESLVGLIEESEE